MCKTAKWDQDQYSLQGSSFSIRFWSPIILLLLFSRWLLILQDPQISIENDDSAKAGKVTFRGTAQSHATGKGPSGIIINLSSRCLLMVIFSFKFTRIFLSFYRPWNTPICPWPWTQRRNQPWWRETSNYRSHHHSSHRQKGRRPSLASFTQAKRQNPTVRQSGLG